MICLEVINLLPENQGPDILAEKLNDIESIGKTRSIDREPSNVSKAPMVHETSYLSTKP